jgi:hypothetical protein
MDHDALLDGTPCRLLRERRRGAEGCILLIFVLVQ